MARPKARQEAIDRANKAAHVRLSQATFDPTKNIGCNGWWNITEGYRKDAALVIDAWRAAGLDPDADLPEIPDGDKAFTRAIRGCIAFAGGFDCRLENLETDASGTRRVSVMHVVKNGHAEGTEIGKVALPDQGRPFVEIDDQYGIAQKIVASTDPRVGLFTGEDLRRGITTVIERNLGSPCREGGVVYWLPPPAVEELRKVDVALHAIEAGSFDSPDLAPTPTSIATAVKAANTGVEVMLADLVKQVNDWRLKPPAKFATVEDRMGQLADLKGRADLLRTMLGSGVKTVDQQLSALSQEFLSIMGLVNQNAGAGA
jgi:hypothetical protein